MSVQVAAYVQGDLRRCISHETRKELSNLAVPRPWRSWILYLNVYLAIATAMIIEAWAQRWFVTLIVIVFIAGRQHSLYILNHDASHYGLYKSRQTNKAVGMLLSNLVMFHHPEAWSFVQWRRVHMLHHAYVFTAKDANYVGRKMQGNTSTPVTVGKLIVSCVKAGLLSSWQLLVSKQDYVAPKERIAEKGKLNHFCALILPFLNDTEMEFERRIKIFFFVSAFCFVYYFDLWRPFLLLWILPMYTIYPMILTFMDLTEHRWTVASRNVEDNARSVRVGLIARTLLSHLPRGLHLEHHLYPNVVAVDLPKLSNLLQRDKVTNPPLSFSGLIDDMKKVELLHAV